MGRKWKLPREQKHSQTLGLVLHAVCDRFYRGEELYPPNWEVAYSKYTGDEEGRLGKADQALVSALVNAAIAEGILIQDPGIESEKEFKLHLAVVNGLQIVLTGCVDVVTPESIDDHKVTGAPRYYNEKALRNAHPMLIYAAVMAHEGKLEGESVWLRYNLFIKDPDNPKVKRVSVEVTQEELSAYVKNTLMPLLDRMTAAEVKGYGKEDWASVPCDERACDDYGGCPFRSICSGKESVDEYCRRFADSGDREGERNKALARLQGSSEVTENKKETGMNILKTVTQQYTQSTQSKETTTTPAPEAVVLQTAPAVATDRDMAPWANPECKACATGPIGGITKLGKACPGCKLYAKKTGLPDPADYEIIADTDSGTLLVLNGDGEEVASSNALSVGVAA